LCLKVVTEKQREYNLGTHMLFIDEKASDSTIATVDCTHKIKY
jgi:hypothetical protein